MIFTNICKILLIYQTEIMKKNIGINRTGIIEKSNEEVDIIPSTAMFHFGN